MSSYRDNDQSWFWLRTAVFPSQSEKEKQECVREDCSTGAGVIHHCDSPTWPHPDSVNNNNNNRASHISLMVLQRGVFRLTESRSRKAARPAVLTRLNLQVISQASMSSISSGMLNRPSNNSERGIRQRRAGPHFRFLSGWSQWERMKRQQIT